jgi:hypothetical protein
MIIGRLKAEQGTGWISAREGLRFYPKRLLSMVCHDGAIAFS